MPHINLTYQQVMCRSVTHERVMWGESHDESSHERVMWGESHDESCEATRTSHVRRVTWRVMWGESHDESYEACLSMHIYTDELDTNESCHITHTNEACPTYEQVMCQRVTYQRVMSCHTYTSHVISHIPMRHVPHTNRSCANESLANESCHVTHTHTACLTYHYRVAKTHRIPYLYRSFSAKEPYI